MKLFLLSKSQTFYTFFSQGPSSGSTRQWNCASPSNQAKKPTATKPASTLNASAPPFQGKTVYYNNSGVSGGIHPSSSGRAYSSVAQVYQGQQGQVADGPGNPVRFFIMKCNDPLNIDLSCGNGLWCVSPSTGQILSKAFKVSS